MPKHTYKSALCLLNRKPSAVCVCLCVCLEAWITALHPVIGAHTYYLSVSLKLQKKETALESFPVQHFLRSYASLPPSLLCFCLSVGAGCMWPFVQSSAGLINHTHSSMQWHR